MKIKRAASVPLVVHDPFFSIWSPADHLYDEELVHWSGARQKTRGYIKVDGKTYAFLGNAKKYQAIPQKYIDVTATATEYVFENDEVVLKCRFTSPLLLPDFYADGYLHPNAKGFGVYALNLIKELNS